MEVYRPITEQGLPDGQSAVSGPGFKGASIYNSPGLHMEASWPDTLRSINMYYNIFLCATAYGVWLQYTIIYYIVYDVHKYTTMYYNILLHTTIYYSALQYTTMCYNILQCTTIEFYSLHASDICNSGNIPYYSPPPSIVYF